MSTSAMGCCHIDPREKHSLCAKFSRLLRTLGKLLNGCADVDEMKEFLQFYSHPNYPEKRYIEPHVYQDAKTAADIIFFLFPTYINYMQYYLLKEIVHEYGTDACRECLQKYEYSFQTSVKKLRDHPAPMTDDEIEVCSNRKRLKVFVLGDIDHTTEQNVQEIQTAIEQTTAIDQVGHVFAYQDLGNSVIFTFLIPESVVQLFYELSDDDLDILATAGVMKIQVEELEIIAIKRHTQKISICKKTSSFTLLTAREQVKPTSLEHYLMERQEIPSQERDDLKAMVKMISKKQMNEVCSEDLLQKFSFCLQNWRVLAPFLGVTDFYTKDFTTRYPRVEDQNYQLLLYWKGREGENALFCNLLETVVIHGKAEEVKALAQLSLKGLFGVCFVSLYFNVYDTSDGPLPLFRIFK